MKSFGPLLVYCSLSLSGPRAKEQIAEGALSLLAAPEEAILCLCACVSG